jgi:hypothetical protein
MYADKVNVVLTVQKGGKKCSHLSWVHWENMLIEKIKNVACDYNASQKVGVSFQLL